MEIDQLKDFSKYLSEHMPENLSATSEINNGELTLKCKLDSVLPMLSFLRDDAHCYFKILVDISAVDYPDRAERFEVVYHLLSITYNRRIRVKVEIFEEALVPSALGLFSAAGWLEREVWDMYGIYFSGHPDLRRILTDYGFSGHPLRKDFPLTGYVEVRYDYEKKHVVYEPVKLEQDFRNFDFLMPWDGTEYKLPGDEKAVKGTS